MAVLSFASAPVQAADDTEALAKAAQNPVADMISLPFQFNTNFGTGPYDGTQEILNVQPVIPFNLSPDWNLITRIIAPLVEQPKLYPGDNVTYGLGDITPTLFLSPATSGKFIWGAGPVFMLPTATSPELGSGKWGIGPSAVGLVMDGHWVYGALVNNIWSFAGDSSRENVNQMTLQPFVNYNFSEGWYLTSSPLVTANWEADNDNRWTLPIGGGFGRVFQIGKQPINAQLSAYYNAIAPDSFGSEWQLRFNVQFLFPDKK
ncbi:neuromedin U [Kaistia algarum]|nr:neuromedin U [Kaistia algarum]